MAAIAMAREPKDMIPNIPRSNPKIHSENRKKCKSCKRFPCNSICEPLDKVCNDYEKRKK